MTVTPSNKVYSIAEVQQMLGECEEHTEHKPLICFVEKAPSHISKYLVESSSEVRIFKREKGIHIQLRNAFHENVNFILFDEQIVQVVSKEQPSTVFFPRFSFLFTALSILFTFVIDAALNKSRLYYFPLLTGLLLGMLVSLFFSRSKKYFTTILAVDENDHSVLILSNSNSYKLYYFFDRYYYDKFKGI